MRTPQDVRQYLIDSGYMTSDYSNAEGSPMSEEEFRQAMAQSDILGPCGRCGSTVVCGEGTEIYPEEGPMLIHVEGCAREGDVNDMCMVFRNGRWENE